MTGRALTLAELDERRLELVDIKAQLRAIGRRKSVVETEILTGRVAPVKGATAEQLPLVETVTATTAPDAPARAPEAAKPAAATATARTAAQQREAVLAALRAAKGRRSGQVLATLLGESEEDVHECLMELIQRGEARSARRGGYEATDKPQPPSRDVKPGKGRKPLWKPGYKPGILPSLTAEGNRRALEMIAAAPGKKVLTSVVRAALDLPDDCCTPSGCYYQGSQAGGDWWGIRDDGAAPPRAKKPAGKAPAAKKAKAAAKGKKVSKVEAPAPPPAAPSPAPAPQASRQELLRKAIMDELGHGLATFGELLTTCMRDLAWTSQEMPKTTEVRDVLKALCEEGKVVWNEAKKVYHLPPPPPPPPAPKKTKAKKVPEAPRPTVTVGEAMEKMLAEYPPQRWQKTREMIALRLRANRGYPIPVAGLYLSGDQLGAEVDAVLVLLEEAGATHLKKSGPIRLVECGSAVGEADIPGNMLRLTQDYVFGLVADSSSPPTTDELARSLELPRNLTLSVLGELEEAKRLRRGNQGRWEVVSAQARTAPLFDDAEPAPAVDGLEPEGDGS